MPLSLTNHRASFRCKVYYNQWESVLTKYQRDVQQQSRRRYTELWYFTNVGQDGVVSTVTRYVLDGSGFKSRQVRDFLHRPERLCIAPSLLYNRYWIFPAVKWQGQDTDHLTLRLEKEQSHTSTPPLCHHGMLQDEFYLVLFYTRRVRKVKIHHV